MMRLIGWIVTVVLVAGGVVYVDRTIVRPPAPETQPAPVEHVSRPTIHIEQVRQLAALVTMEVPISDVHVSEVSGLTGSLRLVVAVQGDVQVGTDLSAARFDDVDDVQHTATVVLPRPMPMRPRIDHDRTRVVGIQRGGLWQFLLGQAGESELTNRALAAAQNALIEAANDPKITQKACGHTEQVIHQFFAALGWDVSVQWEEPLAVK